MKSHRLFLSLIPALVIMLFALPAGASSVEYLNYTQDYVDATSDLRSPSDIGTHNVFADLQDFGTNYDTMQEENTGVGTDYTNFVDTISNLHSPADLGTHSSFAEEQDKDSNYDTLTEADTTTATSTFGDTSGSGTSYRTTAANEVRLGVYTASSNGEVASIVFYGRGSASTSCKAIIASSTGIILSKGVGAATTVSATAGTKTLTYSSGSRPIVTSGTTYWIGMIWLAAGRVYYDSTTGATSKQDTTNSYTAPTDPADAGSTTETWRLMYANVNDINYGVDLEVGWTSANYTQTNEELCIYGGTQDSEALMVDVWSGAAWTNMIADVAAGWNNVSVSSYLTSSAFEIRFVDARSTPDASSAGTWQVEGVLLHCWSTGADNYELDLEVGWTSADYNEGNEYLCIYPVTGGGWPSENILVKIWSGSWTMLFSDLTPDTWNNVSISTYLTDASVEVQFLGGTETSDTTQDTFTIDAVLITTYSYLYIETFDEVIGVADSDQVSMTAGLFLSETLQVSDSLSVAADFSIVFNEIIQISESVSVAGSFVLEFFEQIVFSESVTVSALFILSFMETIGLAVFGESSKFIVLEIFETFGISSSATTGCSFSLILNEVVSISQFSTFIGGAILYKLTFYEVINVYAATPILTAYRPSIFYDLFLSLEMWGYFGPLALVLIGYFVTKKAKEVGIFFIIVDSLIIYTYLTLVEATPQYWWHIFIVILGVIQCTFRLASR